MLVQRNDRNKPKVNLGTAGVAPSRAIVQFCSTSCAIFSFDYDSDFGGKRQQQGTELGPAAATWQKEPNCICRTIYIIFISFERVSRLHGKLVEH